MIQYDWKSGTRFGRLMCTGKSYMKSKSNRVVEVICDCNTIKWLSLQHIKKGLTTSCGCYNLELMLGNKRGAIHEITNHPIYASWHSMKQRCYDENSDGFEKYGKIGIYVCDEWKSNPKAFYDWSIENGWKEGLTIDRHPNKNGIYEPTNCRWATDEQQSRNRSSNREIYAFGETKLLIEWSEDERCVVKPNTLYSRIFKGWDAEKAITIRAFKHGGQYKKDRVIYSAPKKLSNHL